jgi:hypothetical protein
MLWLKSQALGRRNCPNKVGTREVSENGPISPRFVGVLSRIIRTVRVALRKRQRLPQPPAMGPSCSGRLRGMPRRQSRPATSRHSPAAIRAIPRSRQMLPCRRLAIPAPAACAPHPIHRRRARISAPNRCSQAICHLSVVVWERGRDLLGQVLPVRGTPFRRIWSAAVFGPAGCGRNGTAIGLARGEGDEQTYDEIMHVHPTYQLQLQISSVRSSRERHYAPLLHQFQRTPLLLACATGKFWFTRAETRLPGRPSLAVRDRSSDHEVIWRIACTSWSCRGC